MGTEVNVKPYQSAELLRDTLRRHCNVNAFEEDWVDTLRHELNSPKDPTRNALFRRQLADAIIHKTITPQEYRDLTGEDFDTQQDLENWLRELWLYLYGNAPIA